MITKVLGNKIENIYSVDDKKKKTFNENGELVKEVFTGKPELVKKSEVKEWKELCAFEGKPSYNKGDRINYFGLWTSNGDRLNISEDETVRIDKQIFRADLNELHLYSNKTVSETDVEKQQSEYELKKLIREFNETMIDSNDKLKAYCEVHKLYKPETDCIELFKVIYPVSEYMYSIEDGKMKAIQISTVNLVTSTSLDWSSNSSIMTSLDTLSTKISSYDGSNAITTCHSNLY